jgi:hypothetical protein
MSLIISTLAKRKKCIGITRKSIPRDRRNERDGKRRIINGSFSSKGCDCQRPLVVTKNLYYPFHPCE